MNKVLSYAQTHGSKHFSHLSESLLQVLHELCTTRQLEVVMGATFREKSPQILRKKTNKNKTISIAKHLSLAWEDGNCAGGTAFDATPP